MKIAGIGDVWISGEDIKRGFAAFAERGDTIETVEWQCGSYDALQAINLAVETGGSDAYEPPEAIKRAVEDADIIITQFCTVTRDMIDRCPHLKAIGVLRGGYDNVNVAYATQKGIAVYNTPGRNANSVADYTVGLMIAECRNIAKAHMNLKLGNWVRDYTNKETMPDLSGKTAGIVGFGAIGKKVAQRLKGFEMELLVYDPYFKPTAETKGIELVSLETLLQRSDFVTLHCRLTQETERLFDAHMLSLMKPTAYFINTSRSGLVDEKALWQALKDHKIMGAALDVYDREPPGKDYPLVTLDNVTLSPHMAGGSRDAFTQSPGMLAREMLSFPEDKTSRFLVNPNVL